MFAFIKKKVKELMFEGNHFIKYVSMEAKNGFIISNFISYVHYLEGNEAWIIFYKVKQTVCLDVYKNCYRNEKKLATGEVTIF